MVLKVTKIFWMILRVYCLERKKHSVSEILRWIYWCFMLLALLINYFLLNKEFTYHTSEFVGFLPGVTLLSIKQTLRYTRTSPKNWSEKCPSLKIKKRLSWKEISDF